MTDIAQDDLDPGRCNVFVHDSFDGRLIYRKKSPSFSSCLALTVPQGTLSRRAGNLLPSEVSSTC
jgi:hypothetical protein